MTNPHSHKTIGKQVQALAQRIDELEQERDALREEVEQRKIDNSEMAEQRDDCITELCAVKHERDDLREQLAEARREAAEAQATIKAAYRITSLGSSQCARDATAVLAAGDTAALLSAIEQAKTEERIKTLSEAINVAWQKEAHHTHDALVSLRDAALATVKGEKQ